MKEEKYEYEKIQVDLPNLLKILSENLYSNNHIAIRELIQNAHDACKRRIVEDEAPSYHPKIEINADNAKGVLIIKDNGAGLTKEEIQQYISTIGRGYTRELREELALFDWEKEIELIGQFGLGLLSAFVIADEVSLYTTSYKQPDKGWFWSCDGTSDYKIREMPAHETGTIFYLKLKSRFLELLKHDVLKKLIIYYADFLTVPIHLNNSMNPVNSMNAALYQPKNEVKAEDFESLIKRRLGHDKPLLTIPLHDAEVKTPDGVRRIPLRGVLIVPPSSTISIKEYGKVMIYIRRMFICESHSNLLPDWAKFITGIIDSPALSPTASREDVMLDENFIEIQKAIAQQITDALRKLIKQEPSKWRRLAITHNNLIKGWAMQRPEFFAEVAEVANFPSNKGQINLSEYTEKYSNIIYYFTDPRASWQARTLLEPRNIPVIDAQNFVDEEFILAYKNNKPEIEAHKIEEKVDELLIEITDYPAENWEHLKKIYEQMGFAVKLTSFEPSVLPALVVLSNDFLMMKELDNVLDSDIEENKVARFFLEEAHRLYEESRTSNSQKKIYLNFNSKIIRMLINTKGNHVLFENLAMLVIESARLFSSRLHSAEEAIDIFNGITKVINNILTAVSSDCKPNKNDCYE